MATFDSSLEQVFPVKASPERVAAHFADLSAIAAATTQAVSTALDEEARTVHFVLGEQQHGPYTFQPDYTVRYVLEGDTLTWDTLSGNTDHRGVATFAPRADGGTDIQYRTTLSFDLPIPRLLAGPIKGIVARIAQPSLRKYVVNMLASLPAA